MDTELLLRNFLDEKKRLKQYPVKRKMKIYALIYLACKFESGRDYSQSEVNDILNDWSLFNDAATLRRELCDNRFLNRTSDGRTYRLEETQPTPAELGIDSF